MFLCVNCKIFHSKFISTLLNNIEIFNKFAEKTKNQKIYIKPRLPKNANKKSFQSPPLAFSWQK